MGKSAGSAPSPDPNVGIAARENVRLGRDWMNFAREQFNDGNRRQADLDALTKRVTDQQLATQNESNAMAREDRQRYQTVFQPLQDSFIKTANEYDTPAKQEAMAAEAAADVQRASASARDANIRSMASMGVAPGSGRFSGIDRAQDTATSLASAGAQNMARQGVRDKALALKADAINLGNGLPSSTASAYGTGLNAGNSATGNAGNAIASWRGNVGVMNSGFQGAMGGNQSAGGMLNAQYGNQLQGWGMQQQAAGANSAGLMGAVGTLGGAAIMAF